MGLNHEGSLKLKHFTLFADFGREGGRAKQRPGESTNEAISAQMHVGVTHPSIASLAEPLFCKQEKRVKRTGIKNIFLNILFDFKQTRYTLILSRCPIPAAHKNAKN